MELTLKKKREVALCMQRLQGKVSQIRIIEKKPLAAEKLRLMAEDMYRDIDDMLAVLDSK